MPSCTRSCASYCVCTFVYLIMCITLRCVQYLLVSDRVRHTVCIQSYTESYASYCVCAFLCLTVYVCILILDHSHHRLCSRVGKSQCCCSLFDCAFMLSFTVATRHHQSSDACRVFSCYVLTSVRPSLGTITKNG